jgi:hypothetical protein
MRPNSATRPEYLAAFTELVQRIAAPLCDLPRRSLPIKMYVAGGAAMHFYTGERISNDLAVSKISRFSSQDRDDITALAKHGLIKSAALRRRSRQAVENYVGNLDTLKGSIDLACRIVKDAEQRNSG